MGYHNLRRRCSTDLERSDPNIAFAKGADSDLNIVGDRADV